MQDQPSAGYGCCQCGCGQRTNLAKYTSRPRGWVAGEPVKFVVGHSKRGRSFTKGPDFRIEDRGHTTPCWIWARHISTQGYGVAKFGPRTAAPVKAHRFVYERLVGPVPDGLELDHLCRVRSCVNPDHLEAVSHAENTRRGANAKLTHAIAAEIRASADRPRAALAAQYGVSESAIYRILSGATWTMQDSV